MASLSLDQIKDMVQEKYAPLIVSFGEGKTVKLQSALMLPKEQRAALVALQDSAKKEEGDDSFDEDQTREQLRALIKTVADNPAVADEFLAEIAGESYELALLSEVLNQYGERTQTGEASPSQS